jgi:hypothetical protein
VSRFAPLVALSLILGCASVPAPMPAGDGGLIGLSLRVRSGWLIPGRTEPETVYLVRLDEETELETGSWLISSNYAENGYIYFMNAPPGRYAIVAAYYVLEYSTCSVMDPDPMSRCATPSHTRASHHTVYWPRELIERTLIELQPSSSVFVGHVELDCVRKDEPDDVQAHYSSILGPLDHSLPVTTTDLSLQGRGGPYLWDRYHTPCATHSLDRSSEAQRAFFDQSRELLGKPWKHVFASAGAAGRRSSELRDNGIARIELGMNGAQVRAVLGRPSSVRARGTQPSIRVPHSESAPQTDWSYEGLGWIVFDGGGDASHLEVREVHVGPSTEAWPTLERSDAAVADYPPSEPARPRANALSLRITSPKGADLSEEGLERFENTLSRELEKVGFEVSREPSDVTLEIDLKELTTGSRAKRLLSVLIGNPFMQYSMTISGPDGEILGRSDWELEFRRSVFAKAGTRPGNPDVMSDSAILNWLIEPGAAEIVAYTILRGRRTKETHTAWSDLHLIKLVLSDRVETEYSSGGIAELEHELVETLPAAGYAVGEGSDTLTLEIDVVEYEPGSRAKRVLLSDLRLVGFPEMGESSLVYNATLRDASGEVVGKWTGEKRFTGNEFALGDNPGLRSNEQLRKDMAEDCADEIIDHVRNLQVGDVSAGP